MRLVFLSAQQRRINCEEVDSGGLGMTFEFNKRAELFVGADDKAPSVVAVCVCDPISRVNLDLGKIWLRNDVVCSRAVCAGVPAAL